MKRIAISALVAGGLFAGLFGAAGAAQAQSGAIGAAAQSGAVGAAAQSGAVGAAAQSGAVGAEAVGTPNTSDFVNRDVVAADGSVNHGGGGWDQTDSLAPSRQPLIQNGSVPSYWGSHHNGYGFGFGYGYGNSYNYLLWD